MSQFSDGFPQQADRLEKAPLGAHFSTLTHGILDDCLICGDYGPFQTAFWDLAVWPPRLAHVIPEFAVSWARSREGRWLLSSETNRAASPKIFRPRLFGDLSGPPDGDFPLIVDGNQITVRQVGFVGGKPVAFQAKPGNARVGDLLPPPLALDGNNWKPIPALSPAVATPSILPQTIESPVVGTVGLQDGADVLIWNGDGYEQRGDRFEKTFAMSAKKPESQWSYATAGDDGFFYLSNRCLFETRRGFPPQAHAPKWTNIMYVRPGPPGSILIQEGDNKQKDVGKLYFPADGAFIHIEPELFDDKKYSFIYWSPSDRFIVLGAEFLAIPTSAVLALPRYNAATNRKIRK